LIELLVVVAVITVLIAILLPSLGSARRIARTAVCGTNLRSITQAMATYGTEYNGAILGNPQTTSAYLVKSDRSGLASGISESGNVPGVISSNDWLTPTAKIMGQTFNDGGLPGDRIDRFMQFNAFKAFNCPENDIVSTAYTGEGGPNFPVHRMISYNTALCFQFVNSVGNSPILSLEIPANFVDLGGYRPNVNRVGNTSEKVYIADGGRWFNGSGSVAITTNGAVIGGSPGGLTNEWGPWNSNTRAYINPSGANSDGRTVSMRHGIRKSRGSLSGFKFNLAFFDAHVEAMNGLDGADPSLWVPTGGKPSTGEYISDNDFRARYGANPPIR
jgi:type II secretory pathway pseudopilin PulG